MLWSNEKGPLPPPPPGRLSFERVGLMTWWLWVRSTVEANFLSCVFSLLTSAEACEKSCRWLWKEKLWCEKARKHMCVIDRHDMTLPVKVALNPNTTNPTRKSWLTMFPFFQAMFPTFSWRNPFIMTVICRPQMASIWTSQESVVK